MPTKTKVPELTIPENEDEELEEVVGELDRLMLDSMTTAVPKEKPKYNGPRVQVFLPRLEDSGEEGILVDQYEHVTIANEMGTENYRVLRGEWVDVPVPVFLVLKERYPKL